MAANLTMGKWNWNSPAQWDGTDRAKVRHMLGRGKSVEFVHQYTGMPMTVIEQVKRQLDQESMPDRRLRERTAGIDRAGPIAPDYQAMLREDKKLERTNREFVSLIREAGLVPA